MSRNRAEGNFSLLMEPPHPTQRFPTAEEARAVCSANLPEGQHEYARLMYIADDLAYLYKHWFTSFLELSAVW